MKKKLVAFAVTAAMVITSAVPVFATPMDWNQPADPVVDGNVITIDKERTTTDGTTGTVADGVTFDTVIDLNRETANTQLTLKFTDGTNAVDSRTVQLINEGTSYKVDAYGDTVTNLTGIITLQWNVTADGITVGVIEHNYDELAEDTVEISLPTGATNVTGLTVTPFGGKIVMYGVAPEEIVDVEVVKLKGESGTEIMKDEDGNPVIAEQAVEGERYAVYSITLDDGTVITDQALMKKYATFTWKATKDGKDVDISGVVASDGTRFNVKKDRFDGCKITLDAAGKKSAGIYGGALWGANSDPLAIADRYAGENRYETALAVADALKAKNNGAKFDYIVVASGEEFADALSGTAFAAKKDAPILLVNGAYEQEVKDYIYANMIYNGTVYILGGEKAVSTEFEKSIAKHNVVRLGGADRYATNIEILKEMGASAKKLVVVSGANFADALSASSLNRPVFIVGDELTEDQVKYLDSTLDKNTKKATRDIIVIGGTSAISFDTEKELVAYDQNKAVVRLGGADRYETSYNVASSEYAVKGNKSVVLASGAGFGDGLAGGVFAMINNSPLILVNDADPADAERYMTGKTNALLTVIGGEAVISNETVQNIYAQKIA